MCFRSIPRQARHLLLQLEHEHPVLGVLVERVDDKLCEICPYTDNINFSQECQYLSYQSQSH